MILSMTGFGKSNGVFASKKVSVEIRSLNSKGLDLSLKLHASYRELESEIRKIVAERLDRGKVDIGIYLESSQENAGLLNRELATRYYHELKSLNESWGEQPQDYLSMVLRMPEVLNQQSDELSEEEKAFILQLVNETCDKLMNFRATEGKILAADFQQRIDEIRNLLKEIEPFETERVQQVRDRIIRSLTDLQGIEFDNNRLEQEMIFYIEKLDISEEKIRLSNHLDYFIETMNISMSGKKLGFIAQEIGREINTLGSKSNHAEMQRRVVEMKDMLEKIKEQILNTL